jgi:hypothetical protein
MLLLLLLVWWLNTIIFLKHRGGDGAKLCSYNTTVCHRSAQHSIRYTPSGISVTLRLLYERRISWAQKEASY